MNKATYYLRKSAGMLDLPADILAGLPRVEWVGLGDLSVEPHGGLLSYDPEEIKVSTRAGVLAVRGEKLSLKLMNSSRITVEGIIKSVELMEQAVL